MLLILFFIIPLPPLPSFPSARILNYKWICIIYLVVYVKHQIQILKFRDEIHKSVMLINIMNVNINSVGLNINVVLLNRLANSHSYRPVLDSWSITMEWLHIIYELRDVEWIWQINEYFTLQINQQTESSAKWRARQ